MRGHVRKVHKQNAKVHSDKCAARESEEAGVVAGCCNHVAPREPHTRARLKEAARDDVTTAQTTNGIQTRQRAHRMRRTAMPRTAMEMAERSVVA